MSDVRSSAIARRWLAHRGVQLFSAACSLLLVACVAGTHAQSPMQGRDPSFTSPNAGSMSHESMSDAADIDPVLAAKRQQAQRAEIRQSLAADSTKLVQLAQELNEQISRDHPETLTQAELKKYAEIGKLARRLKSQMKDYGTAGTQIQPLPGIVPDPDRNGKHQR